MNLATVLSEIRKITDEYNSTSLHLTRQQIQKYRDDLSHLNATLAYFNADFYEDYVKAVFNRKLGVAKKAEELLKSREAKSSAQAERMAMVACEELYEQETLADSANTRCKLIREQVGAVLNSIASRMNIPHE